MKPLTLVHTVETPSVTLAPIVAVLVFMLSQAVSTVFFTALHLEDVHDLTLSHAVEIPDFTALYAFAVLVLIPSHAPEIFSLMAPHAFAVPVLMFSQALPMPVFNLFSAPSKNLVILPQASRIPPNSPSIRYLPISAKTVDGEWMPNASLKPWTKPPTNSLMASQTDSQPSLIPSMIDLPMLTNPSFAALNRSFIFVGSSLKKSATSLTTDGIVSVKKRGNVSVKNVEKPDLILSQSSPALLGIVSVTNV